MRLIPSLVACIVAWVLAVPSIAMLFPALAFGQANWALPGTARSWTYFPQIADGLIGGDNGWTTTITLTNPSNLFDVSGSIWFSNPAGEPWQLSFGSGHSSLLDFSLGLLQTTEYTTSGIGFDDRDALRVGSATVQADGPVLAVATYSRIIEGRPVFSVGVPAVLPSPQHTYSATRSTGIALRNPYAGDYELTVVVRAFGNDGRLAGLGFVSVPPRGQRSFSLWEEIDPELPQDFLGTIILSSTYDPDPSYFAALVLREDQGVYSALPNGSVARPLQHEIVIDDIFKRIQREAADDVWDFPDPEDIELNIEYSDEFNAYGGHDGIEFHVPLSSSLRDSESEIAFVVAHEIGHVYQSRTGNLDWHQNRELDADAWGVLLSFFAGYDPYGAAGALAKMNMVLGTADLATQQGRQFEYLLEFLTAGGEYSLHGSFNERLDHIYRFIRYACEKLPDLCESYRNAFHPSFPDTLLWDGPRGPQ